MGASAVVQSQSPPPYGHLQCLGSFMVLYTLFTYMYFHYGSVRIAKILTFTRVATFWKLLRAIY